MAPQCVSGQSLKGYWGWGKKTKKFDTSGQVVSFETPWLIEAFSLSQVVIVRINFSLLKKSEHKMFPLLHRNLPHVEDKILSYLGPKDAASSMLVCREWCQKARPHVYKWYAILLRRKGYIPLQMAVLQGYDHIFAYLLEDKKVDVNERYSDGPTALITAVKYNNERIVRMLLEREDTDVNIISGFGDRTALYWAAINNFPGIVRMLVERTDILVNTHLIFHGRTVLMEAVIRRHVRVCE